MNMLFWMIETHGNCCCSFQVVFFTNSGTEANELALMIARLYTGCNDIISLRNGYHGNAAGTMGATAQSNWKFNVVQVGTPFCFHYCNKVNCTVFSPRTPYAK